VAEETKNRDLLASPDSMLHLLHTGTGELMSALMDNAPAPILISREDSTIIYVNPATEQLTGYSASELIGTRPPFPWWPEKLKSHYSTETANASKQAIAHPERMGIRKNGEKFWMSISVRHIQREDKPGYFISTCMDITERKKMEDSLKESEAFKDTLLSQAPNPILVCGGNDVIRYVNPAFEKLSGYTRAEIVGLKPPYPWWPDEYFALYLEKPQPGKNIPVILERVYQKKDGRLFWVSINLRQIRNKGKVKLLIANWFDITQRKKMEDALKESDVFKENLLVQAPNPIVVYNTDHSVKYVNPAFEKLTGYSSAEVIGLNYPYPWWSAQFTAQFDTKRPSDTIGPEETLERCYQKKNGELFWVSVSLGHIRENEKISLHISNWVDITARRKAEQDLKESEAFTTSMLEYAPNPILVVNPDSSIRYVNAALEKVTGYSRHEILGSKAPYPWFLKEEVVEFNRIPARRTEEVQNRESRLINKNGTVVWINQSIRAIRENGKTKFVVGNWVDITERKRVEEELKESEEKHRLLVENTHDIIYTLSAAGIFTFVSSSWTEILGQRTDQVIGQSFQQFVHPEDVPSCQAYLDSFILKGQRQEGIEYRVRHIDGSWHIHSTNAAVYKDKTGVTFYGIARDVTESKKAEDALKESEAFTASLLQYAPHPVLVVNADRSVRYINPALEKLTGFTADEVLGKYPPYPWWSQEFFEKLKNNSIKRTQETDYEENCFRKKNGDPFWIALSIRHIKENGKIKYIMGNWVDITERKKAEEALKESEAFKSVLLNDAPNPIFVFLPDSTIIYANTALEMLSGYSNAELIGRNTPYPWWPRDRQAHYQHEFENINQTAVSYFERNYLKKNGDTFWATVSIRSIKQDGEIKYYIANWLDITQRKNMEDALRESESFNLSLLTEAPNPVLVLNPDQTLRYVNPATEKLTGFSQNELIGIDPPHPWWRAEDYEKNMKEVAEDRNNQESIFEKYFKKKNGEPFWVVINNKKIYENNQLKYILGNWVDITQQKKLEERISELYAQEKKHREELQEEAQARGLFINVLAHELRAPLTPIMVSTGMLRDLLEPQKKDVLTKLATNIYSSTEKLSLRLEELLDLARYDRGTFRLNLQLVSLKEFLDEVVQRFEPAIIKRKQQMITRFDPGLPSAKIDPSRLEQVLINLLSNASKFSADGTSIVLQAGLENSQLFIEVQDHGIGISPENQVKLFRPYHRVEQDRKQFPGLGLGLSVSRQIIEAHGGNIWVKSQTGQGSTFGFNIPLNP
jgi:PAS domain S-box-containing protein